MFNSIEKYINQVIKIAFIITISTIVSLPALSDAYVILVSPNSNDINPTIDNNGNYNTSYYTQGYPQTTYYNQYPQTSYYNQYPQTTYYNAYPNQYYGGYYHRYHPYARGYARGYYHGRYR